MNGAECETHLTCDHRLMLEKSGRIVDGLRAAMRALNVKRGVIAIEDNKPDAIEAMTRAAQGRNGVEVMPLQTKYPQGGEKQLIHVVTGREVPTKKLPLDVHVIVLNVGTAYAIADAVIEGKNAELNAEDLALYEERSKVMQHEYKQKKLIQLLEKIPPEMRDELLNGKKPKEREAR